MSPYVKYILAVITGLIVGGAVNMIIIMFSGYLIPSPEGANLLTAEGLKASMHLMQPKHFIMPFLAHALGTFSGALTANTIAARNTMRISLIISLFFMLGGLINVIMLPSPVWFTLLDLLGAYLPMGFVAHKIVKTKLND